MKRQSRIIYDFEIVNHSPRCARQRVGRSAYPGSDPASAGRVWSVGREREVINQLRAARYVCATSHERPEIVAVPEAHVCAHIFKIW